MVVVPLQDAPGGAPIVKLKSNKEAGLVELLAVDDFSLHGRPLVDRSNFDLVAGLPTMRRTDANALGTEIIGVGLLFDFAGFRRKSRQADHHHDGEPLFRSSG